MAIATGADHLAVSDAITLGVPGQFSRRKPAQPGVPQPRASGAGHSATDLQLVGTYEGVIVCDALETHEAGARDGPGIVLAGCWARVFRKFAEAEAVHPEASLAMEWIRELYAIDERAGDDLAKKAELRTHGAGRAHTMDATAADAFVLHAVNFNSASPAAVVRLAARGRLIGDTD